MKHPVCVKLYQSREERRAGVGKVLQRTLTTVGALTGFLTRYDNLWPAFEKRSGVVLEGVAQARTYLLYQRAATDLEGVEVYIDESRIHEWRRPVPCVIRRMEDKALLATPEPRHDGWIASTHNYGAQEFDSQQAAESLAVLLDMVVVPKPSCTCVEGSGPKCAMHGMVCDDYAVLAAVDDQGTLPKALRDRMDHHLRSCRYHRSGVFGEGTVSTPVTPDLEAKVAEVITRYTGDSAPV